MVALFVFKIRLLRHIGSFSFFSAPSAFHTLRWNLASRLPANKEVAFLTHTDPQRPGPLLRGRDTAAMEEAGQLLPSWSCLPHRAVGVCKYINHFHKPSFLQLQTEANEDRASKTAPEEWWPSLSNPSGLGSLKQKGIKPETSLRDFQASLDKRKKTDS